MTRTLARNAFRNISFGRMRSGTTSTGKAGPSATRRTLVPSEDVEQLIIGELTWRVASCVGRSKLGEHRVESRRDLVTGRIGRQGCAVHGERVCPDPLDRTSVVEVPAYEPSDFLDERWRSMRSANLCRSARV